MTPAVNPFQPSYFVSTWNEIGQSDPELRQFLEKTLEKPLFFDRWGSILNEYFAGGDLESARNVLRLLWCLEDRLPMQTFEIPIKKLLVELRQNPKLAASYLGILYAHSKNPLSHNVLQPILEMQSNAQASFAEMSTNYFNSFKTHLDLLVGEIPLENSGFKENIIGTEVGRLLGMALIDDMGSFNKPAAAYLLSTFHLYFGYLPELYKSQISLVLNNLLRDAELIDLLQNIAPPHPSKEIDILIQLQMNQKITLTEVHSRMAILGALLSFPRQERGDCYIYAPIIGLLQHDPKPILKNLKWMIESGLTRMPNFFRGVNGGIDGRSYIYSKYATEKLSYDQMASSKPIAAAIHDITPRPGNFEPFAGKRPPFEFIHAFIERQNWPTEMKEEVLRICFNRISSFFQSHLLSSLCQNLAFYSDNCEIFEMGGKSQLVDWLSQFCFIPVGYGELKQTLAPLIPYFKSLLIDNILLERNFDLLRLNVFHREGNVDMDTLMKGSCGSILFLDPLNQEWTRLPTWNHLLSVLFHLAQRALQTLKINQPEADWSGIEQCLAQWPSLKDVLKEGLKEVAIGVAEERGFNYPPDLALTEHCSISLRGGYTDQIFEHFFQIPQTSVKITEPAPLEEFWRIIQTLNAKIPTVSDPLHPPLVLADLKRTEGMHAFNLLPHNDSLKRMWTSSPGGAQNILLAAEMQGKLRSKMALCDEKRQILFQRLHECFPPNSADAASAPLSPTASTPFAILDKWRNNPHLAPHLNLLNMALSNHCIPLAMARCSLTQEHKNHIMATLGTEFQQLQRPDLLLVANILIQNLPNPTLLQLETAWTQIPMIAPFIYILHKAIAPIAATWTQLALTPELKVQLIHSLPPDLQTQASIQVIEPTPETVMTAWRNSPDLMEMESSLQMGLNQIVELVSWNEWMDAVPKLIRSFGADEWTHSTDSIYLLLNNFLTELRTQIEQVQPLTGPYGISLAKGAQRIHEVFAEAGYSWEYNQILNKIASVLNYPTHFLLADLNFSKTLWMGFHYGDDRFGYYTRDEEQVCIEVCKDLSMKVLTFIGDNSQQLPLRHQKV